MPEIHLTVAAVIERDGRYLMVEEHTDEGLRINQPAGHLETGESIADGAIREALEETGYRFVPEWVVGIYRWAHPGGKRVYVRIALSGAAQGPIAGRQLDTGIVRALWLAPDQLRAQAERLRSPLVLACIDDHLAGRRHPLALLREIGTPS